MKTVFKSISEKDTLKLAESFAELLKKSDVVVLKGDLGAGKTTFAKGILKAFGFNKDEVISSSFILMRMYQNKKISVYHADFYRLTKSQILDMQDFWEILTDKTYLKIIEWADIIEGALPEDSIEVGFDYLDLNTREITVEFPDKRKLNLKNE